MILKNYYFYVKENLWPLSCSLTSFNLLSSMLFFFKFSDFSMLVYNLIFTVFSMMMWWNSYSSSGTMEGKFSLNLDSNLKMSFILFILSEIIFFFSFFWGYFHLFLSPSIKSETLVLMAKLDLIPLSATLVLLISGVTLTVGHLFLLEGEIMNCWGSIFMTFSLGVTFSILQYLEYFYSFFSISDSFWGSIFFILTGFHGIHVLIGSFYLIYSSWNIFKFMPSSTSFLMFDLSCWYWHFVDVVWLFVFFSFYYLNF